MKYNDNLLKMKTELSQPVNYYLNLNDKEILLNDLIGHNFKITFKNRINCINCGKETEKSYHQGHCYSCFISIPQTDTGILHPEKDRSHEGISRDMEWAKKNTLIDHFVYLSLTSNLKVGVTRINQLPTRWIDQGASKAIKLAKTPYRKIAGDIEVYLKNFVSDKTNWQKMILSEKPEIDLLEKKKDLSEKLTDELKEFITLDNRIEKFTYPGNFNFDKLKQINLDKEPGFEGKLTGIKGQYLIFSNGLVFNVRKHNGYLTEIETD